MKVSAETGAAALDTWRLGHRPGLDQFRGIAVLMVIAAHCTETVRFDMAGSVAVTMFFVLSGFLITRLLVEERRDRGQIDLRRFYIRRARRLLPALSLGLALGTAVNHALGYWVWTPVASAVSYTANFASTGHDREFGSLTHLWSLSVEEHFYIVWPLVVAVLAGRRLVVFCVALAAAVAVARYLNRFDSLAYRGTHLRIDAMLIGAVLAVVVHRLRRQRRWLVVASWAVVVVFCSRAFMDDLTAWGLVAVCVATCVLIVDALDWTLDAPWLMRVGVISYGLYLYHLPVSFVLRAQGLHGAGLLVATLAGSVALAEASYRLVEEPLRHRSQPVTPAA